MLMALIGLPIALAQAKLVSVDTVVGKGLEARIGDVVLVDYTGTLLTGKQFDSSVGRAPFSFQIGVGQVIKGWDQGLIGMKEGGTRKLTIPSELAYGDTGAGADIPPKSTLNFEIKLIKIQPRATVEVLKKGTGPLAVIGDTVSLNYKGSLKSGKEFDSSYKRGLPFKLVIGERVIPGFTQGLIGVQEGEKIKLTIPAKLAYGERAIPPTDQGEMKAGSIIPANSDLIFEIEILKLNDPKDKK